MGRKRTGERERLFFYLACILIGPLVLGGCALKRNPPVMETEDLMIRGDYSRALEKNQELLEEYPWMGDSALFQMGLISAHPKNPGKNYKKSIRYFQRLIDEFPKSDLKNQAQIWILSLQELLAKDKEIAALQGQIKKLKEIDLNLEEKKKKSSP
jgi:tetratricopeptide (TPR) repeat protein